MWLTYQAARIPWLRVNPGTSTQRFFQLKLGFISAKEKREAGYAQRGCGPKVR